MNEASGSPPGFVATDSQVRVEQVDIVRQRNGTTEAVCDHVSIEEPLEIRVAGEGFEERPLAITMRTPGRDHELTLGFLFGEGIIRSLDDVVALEHCRPPSHEHRLHNAIRIALAPGCAFMPEQLERHFYTTSSCGVCGKSSIESVTERVLSPIADVFRITAESLNRLPASLRERQSDFSRTGGIHAAGLINSSGELTVVREDIGRHNAVDKLVGACLLKGSLPLAGHGIMLYGRAGFELVQKAGMAGAEFIAAIGPPSSLSIELARSMGVTLAGFVSDSAFNLYSRPERVG